MKDPLSPFCPLSISSVLVERGLISAPWLLLLVVHGGDILHVLMVVLLEYVANFRFIRVYSVRIHYHY